MVLSGVRYPEMEKRLHPITKRLGIEELLEKYPYEVSGGQKQRTAVARALISRPQLVLADEPTGALDSKAADELLQLFNAVNQEGQTILMVTHSTKAASHAKKSPVYQRRRSVPSVIPWKHEQRRTLCKNFRYTDNVNDGR